VCVNTPPRRRDINNDLLKAPDHLTISLGRVLKTFPNYLESITTARKIFHKWKTFEAVVNLPRSGRPSKFAPRLDCVMLRETAKYTRTTAQTLKASVSIVKC